MLVLELQTILAIYYLPYVMSGILPDRFNMKPFVKYVMYLTTFIY